MTAPIQEPSTDRALQGFAYARDQIFRRPAPVSDATIPVALRATYKPAGGLTVATNTETAIEFDTFENEDTTGDIFGEVTSVGGDLQKVQFRAQGIYTITVGELWEASFDAQKGVLVLDDSGTTGNWALGVTGNMGQYAYAPDAYQFTYPHFFSVTRKWPLFGITPADIVANLYGRILVKVMQRSGIDRDLQACLLDVFYWGPTLTSI